MRLIPIGWFLLSVAHISSGQAATDQQPKPEPKVQEVAQPIHSPSSGLAP
jgi:hypothetical protein